MQSSSWIEGCCNDIWFQLGIEGGEVPHLWQSLFYILDEFLHPLNPGWISASSHTNLAASGRHSARPPRNSKYVMTDRVMSLCLQVLPNSHLARLENKKNTGVNLQSSFCSWHEGVFNAVKDSEVGVLGNHFNHFCFGDCSRNFSVLSWAGFMSSLCPILCDSNCVSMLKVCFSLTDVFFHFCTK